MHIILIISLDFKLPVAYCFTVLNYNYVMYLIAELIANPGHENPGVGLIDFNAISPMVGLK